MNGIFIFLTEVTCHRRCIVRIAILCLLNLKPYRLNGRLYKTCLFHSDETKLTCNYIEIFQSNLPDGKFVLLANQICYTLCEKHPNTEFFLAQIQENKDQKKLRTWTLFTQCKICWKWQSVAQDKVFHVIVSLSIIGNTNF